MEQKINIEAFEIGHTFGENPHQGIEELLFENLDKPAIDLILGFKSGRTRYEKFNGPIASGIPQRIVTQRILEDAMLTGALGMALSVSGFNPSQAKHIRNCYNGGRTQHEPENDLTLAAALADAGIYFAR